MAYYISLNKTLKKFTEQKWTNPEYGIWQFNLVKWSPSSAESEILEYYKCRCYIYKRVAYNYSRNSFTNRAKVVCAVTNGAFVLVSAWKLQQIEQHLHKTTINQACLCSNTFSNSCFGSLYPRSITSYSNVPVHFKNSKFIRLSRFQQCCSLQQYQFRNLRSVRVIIQQTWEMP
jgi:hypothetical protein